MASRMGDDTARALGRVTLNPAPHFDFIGTFLIPMIQIFGPGGIPLMGWAKPTPVQSRNFRPGMLARGQVLVAGAGPASNLVLALVFTGALFVAVRLGLLTVAAGPPVFELIKTGGLINVALPVFNMVPPPPLGGSWVISWGLPRSIAERYDRVMEPYGQFILLALFVTGILSWVVSPVIVAILHFLFRLAL